MDMQNCNFGCDIDGTVTDGTFLIDGLSVDESRRLIRNAPLKKGVEVLSTMKKTTFITCRDKRFMEDSIWYFNKHKIPFHKIIMIDGYEGNKFDAQKYLDFKVNAYLSNDIGFALDDDINVVNALIRHGVKAKQVDGDFREAFDSLFMDDI